MSDDIRSRTHTRIIVRGRKFEVERIRWYGTSGESFDVSDKLTGVALHDESFDERPDQYDIENLLDDLADGLEDGGNPDPMMYGEEELVELREVIAATREPRTDDRVRSQAMQSEGVVRQVYDGSLAGIVQVELDSGRTVDLPLSDVAVLA